ncbi:DUF551 domain-containing protein [Enterobacter ludwigii]|uniref:DUF551 domain-containing protein n=1 Tax=Enterobacter ludwigii TaxID=299767 RepID=UPI0032AEEC1A
MSTIIKEFTKEQLQQIIETDHVQCGEASALARIALASLEAEAVCVIDQSNLDYLKSGSDADVWPASRAEMGDVLLYLSATPAPVSVPAAMEIDDDFDSAFEHGKAVGWNAYRAAMLQAEPVSNSDELPLDYLQGHKDGLEWAAQLAEANHPQTGDWLYDDPIELAKAIRKGPDMPEADGNSPVTPGGWVACSERLPENKPGSYEYLVFEELNNGVHHDYWNVPDAGDDCQFTPFWNHYDRYVTHWQPLPSPPAK